MINLLSLKNFKCFEDEEFYFRPLTLLAGLNGMGKSSVIQSLLLLRQSYLQGLLQRKLIALNGDLTKLGTAHDVLYEDAREDQFSIEIETDKSQASWTFKYDSVSDVLEQVSPKVPKIIFNNSLFQDNFHYLQAERVGPRTSFEMSDYQVRQHTQLGNRGEFTMHFLHQFGRTHCILNNLKHPDEKSTDLLDRVEAWLREVSPGVRIEVNSFLEMDLINLRYSFERGKSVSNSYRSTNTGFGLTYALSIIVAIISSRKDTLILLENPEAHLHPRGQVSMGKMIARAANCGVQILVETHSDHLLNGIRLAIHDKELSPNDVSINFFEQREYNNVRRLIINSPKLDEDGRINQWPEGFFDTWEISLDALLSKKDQ